MSPPPDPPATWLQRLDIAGRSILRAGRKLLRLSRLAALRTRESAEQVLLTRQQGVAFFRLRRQLAAARAGGRVRFYLLDPSYQKDLGHYQIVAGHFAAECARRGWDFFHLTGPAEARAAACFPVFTYAARLPLRFIEPFWDRRENARVLRASARVLRRFAQVLGRVARLDLELGSDHNSYYFYYTGDVLYLAPFLPAGLPGPHQHLAVLQFYLPLHFTRPVEQRWLRRQAAQFARAATAAGPAVAARVRLCTDSPPLQRWLAPQLGSGLDLVFPPFLETTEPAALPDADDLARRPHPCGYFGYLSEKHGWPVVRQLLQDQAGRETHWLIQYALNQGDAAVWAAARATIAAAGARALEGYCPPADFSAALARCQVLLLPYGVGEYAFTSSAKLIVGLRHGCFPIVPANTWLSYFVRECGYGLVIPDGAWRAVPAQLAQINVPAEWARCRDRVAAVLQKFTAAHCLDALAAPRDDAPSAPAPRSAHA